MPRGRGGVDVGQKSQGNEGEDKDAAVRRVHALRGTQTERSESTVIRVDSAPIQN